MPDSLHDKSVDEIAARLAADTARGLSSQEAIARLARSGPNELRKGKTISPFVLLGNQFHSLVIWVLICAALVSAALGEFVDGIAIIAIVVLNAIIGFFQEYRAEQAAAALARLAAPRAKVVRDGQTAVVPATEVVYGDLLLVEAGDLVAADARLIEASALRANEAPLTGESQPLEKQTGICVSDTPLADRQNMVFFGTSIVGGSGRAIRCMPRARATVTTAGRPSGIAATARLTAPRNSPNKGEERSSPRAKIRATIPRHAHSKRLAT